MDDAVAKQLTRQLKLLNFWVTFFGMLFLIAFAIGGFLIFKAVTEIKKAETSISNIQGRASNDLNVQKQLCSAGGTLGSLIKNDTNACN